MTLTEEIHSRIARRVGFWRGMGRYLAIGFFPIVLVVLVWSILDAPTIDSMPIEIYHRAHSVR